MRGFKHPKSEHHDLMINAAVALQPIFFYLLFSFCSHNQEDENSLLISAATPLLVLVWDSRGQAQSWVTLLYPFCFY
jgi:hypothetical protein